MKKCICIAAFIFVLSAAGYAQSADKSKNNLTAQRNLTGNDTAGCPYLKEKGTGGGMMGHGMGGGMMEQGMGGMMGPGMGHNLAGKGDTDWGKSRMMTGRSAAMVASDKGGVIVLYGDQLYKFDKDLNLVNKVELGQQSGCTRFDYHK